jgi:hypothetical protein
MFRKPVHMMFCILFLIAILVGCAKPTEIVTMPPLPTDTQVPPTPTLEPSPTLVPPLGAWNPILATTRAKPAPPAATCPTGSTPDLPGRVDQERPAPGPWSNQSAVFDHHTGRIIFVDEKAQTWTFDVCTNTWENMNPRQVPTSGYWYEGELVYDIDSDLTISFGGHNTTIAVYDAQTNTWTQRDRPSEYEYDLFWLGAVYDPVSGLVLVVTDDGLTAYDVETDEWTPIGMIVEERDVTSEGTTRTLEPPFLIGYVAETDRLAFLGFNGAPFQGNGGLFDPRTGQYTYLDEPPSGVVGGFGSFSYATSGATAYTFASNISVCRLDPVTLDWICHPLPDGSLDQMPSAMVIDTINDRLVLINNFCCNWPGTLTTKDILALDLGTGEWTQLLAPSSVEIDATDVLVEVSALIDDWYAALGRADGSALDLYVPEGYHLYGDQRFDHDEILAHLQGGGIKHEWITEPLLVAQDEDGRYVVVRGMRNTLPSSRPTASALLFEIVTTTDGELRIAQTAWFKDSA